jgi:hypothetical protein
MLSYSETPRVMGIHLNPAVFHAASVALHIMSVVLVPCSLACTQYRWNRSDGLPE